MGEDTPSFSICELVLQFREALSALTPIAERAHLSWRDEDTHDDWERLAERLWDVFVRSPIYADPRTKDAAPLLRYDFSVSSYAENSWIECTLVDSVATYSLLRLSTRTTAFDTLELLRVDELRQVPVADVEAQWANVVSLTFVLQRPDEPAERIDAVFPRD